MLLIVKLYEQDLEYILYPWYMNIGCHWALTLKNEEYSFLGRVITYPFVNYLAFKDNAAYLVLSTNHCSGFFNLFINLLNFIRLPSCEF